MATITSNNYDISTTNLDAPSIVLINTENFNKIIKALLGSNEDGPIFISDVSEDESAQEETTELIQPLNGMRISEPGTAEITISSHAKEKALYSPYNYSEEYLLDNHLFWLQPNEVAFNTDVKPISYPDKYELKQLHLVTRHGARQPDPVNIFSYDTLEKVFANVSVAKDWYKNPFSLAKNYQLVKRGEIEPYFAGIRCRKRYAKFWNGVKYDPEVIKFKSTQTSRTGASMMAFSEGLFNGIGPLDSCKSQPIYYSTIPLDQDTELAPFLACRRWNQTCWTNNAKRSEQIFAYGNKTLAPIAERLTKEYDISPPLDPHLIPQIFTACQYWMTVFNRTDAWCSLLSPDELLLARYYWDMYGYYTNSYGSPLGTQLGCRFLTQLVNGVEEYLDGKSEAIAHLKETHGFTILILLTTMGVFKDDYPLTADLTFEQIKNVKYTEYANVPWSSTLYFEIYTCSDNKEVSIRVVFNDVPFVIPGCGSEYCEWKKFKSIFSDKIGCDFSELCSYPTNPPITFYF
ncbi:2360_t:CDS:2 [Acaulospora morrowiae]|uniref:Multiple inositol polyphosphate phosphatase 1 n=1 Tax=Acaulospora morrowiae TaxID=94023 RepID=A0A9N9G4Z7_9GLOM|nr:2360_t:CDS:2 [Acaulospora morrowiae]